MKFLFLFCSVKRSFLLGQSLSRRRVILYYYNIVSLGSFRTFPIRTVATNHIVKMNNSLNEKSSVNPQ